MFIFALIYLLLPVFVILFTFFSIPFMVMSALALAVLVFSLYISHNIDNNNQFHLSRIVVYWPLLLVALTTSAICVVFPFESFDWARQYATANLLFENSWPPVLEFDGKTWFKRYYVAYYMLPALFAKILGMQSTVLPMFIWTSVGLFVSWVLAFHNLKKAKYFFIAALVFLCFAGLDLVGSLLTNRMEGVNSYWLHWWSGWQVVVILSNLTTFQIAPQHALSAFIVTGLFLFDRRRTLQYSGVIIVAATLWSPFGAVGLLPLALWALLEEGYKTAITPQNLLVAPLLAVPIVLYLAQGTSQLPFAFTLGIKHFSVGLYVMFCVLEFLLPLAIFWKLLKEKRSLLAILAVFLCALCLFKIGVYNDLVARGSMAAICVMSVLMLQSLLQNRGWRRDLLVAYMLVSALPVVLSFGHSMTLPRQRHNITLTEVLDKFRPPPQIGLSYYSSYFLAKTSNATTFFNVPLMRNLGDVNHE